MSNQENNPHFLQQQPLLRSDLAPSHPEHNPHTSPRQDKDSEPLGPRGSLTHQSPDHGPQVPSKPTSEPLRPHPTQPEPAPKWKRQRRQGKDSKPSSTVVLPPPLQSSDHHTILPHVPRSEEPEQPLAPPPVYLVFRPKSPWFDVSNVNLNAAYLDMGYLLNADLVLLVNFTNPNHQVSVDFSSIYLDLYFENTMIATQYVQPFSAPRRKTMLATIHMMNSQVPLAIKESLLFQQQIQNSNVTFDLRAKFRARSKFGSLMRYSHQLHGLCRVIVSSPPTGVLRGKKCITKH
ncbi:hypothetical protein SLEP1_g25463 [Rubroshorea leprosula]|uniref:Late embryogenesis abundant protein LEA-2 subgroup domain-containing protein n=1 Tax=Rubroshorea leprosula TaxID=152421 RepID=A0AAV5JWF8_9ROSI|nr:hypothetical protein SLEP1_g25463 [Rubroshorea leprosula]